VQSTGKRRNDIGKSACFHERNRFRGNDENTWIQNVTFPRSVTQTGSHRDRGDTMKFTNDFHNNTVWTLPSYCAKSMNALEPARFPLLRVEGFTGGLTCGRKQALEDGSQPDVTARKCTRAANIHARCRTQIRDSVLPK
jgi:hypothetical protein